MYTGMEACDAEAGITSMNVVVLDGTLRSTPITSMKAVAL